MVRTVLAPTFKAVLKDADLDYTRLIVRYYSRVYTDMTLVGESFARLGFPGNFLDMMHRDETAERKRIPLRPRFRGEPRLRNHPENGELSSMFFTEDAAVSEFLDCEYCECGRDAIDIFPVDMDHEENIKKVPAKKIVAYIEEQLENENSHDMIDLPDNPGKAKYCTEWFLMA